MSNERRQSRRIPGLNSLRFLAAAGVLLYHAFPVSVPGGFFGVLLFFVISGYLSAWQTLYAMENHTFSLGDYYRKRILRIYPALIIVIFSSIGVVSLVDMYRLADTPREVLSILLGYNNLWQIKMNSSYFTNLTNTSPFTHLWYIAILLQFDLVWPLLAGIYRVLRRGLGKGAALTVFFLLTFVSFLIMPVYVLMVKDANLTAVYYHTITRVFSLFAGMFAGMMRTERLSMRSLRFRSPHTARLSYLLFLILTVVLYIFARGTDLKVYLFGMQGYTILCCLMIEIMIMNRKALQFLIDSKISTFISSLSYEIYLWQYPVLFVLGILYPEGPWYIPLLGILLVLILSLWLHKFAGSLFSGRKKSRNTSVRPAAQE